MPVEKLERNELFELLSPKQMDHLSRSSGVMVCQEGERIYSEGLPASHLFVLVKGRVELTRPTPGGINLLIDDLMAGSIFGVSSLTGTERYLLNADCSEDSEVLKVEAAVLRRMLDDDPVVGYAIQRRLSQIFFKRYVETMEKLRSIVQAIPLGSG